jgi:hypothetical protein
MACATPAPNGPAPEWITQSTERRRCVSCNRWGGARQPGADGDSVVYDAALDRGPCQEGPWHGTLRGPRNACGHWLRWTALAAPAAPVPATRTSPTP